jgi:hypothetical protein
MNIGSLPARGSAARKDLVLELKLKVNIEFGQATFLRKLRIQ